ncbi:MAG: ATP-binding cassette domain-containing protein, partial [Proteobacteria bacterium]|nr:ATP-binding cassette domain-containing protein [Pseudomonadota bacterium]
HVVSYLADFLFPPARTRSPVKTLSGGERNRLLLAKLFAQPANLLVLDEPTNDLDIETLELLEELLSEYDGTLLLVSHDRSFLDRTVTSTLVLDGEGGVEEFVGGYSDWLRQKASTDAEAQKRKQTPTSTVSQPPVKKRAKLSYKEQRELDSLPALIEELEAEQTCLQEQTSDPAFYDQPQAQVAATLQKLTDLQTRLSETYARWEELEA